MSETIAISGIHLYTEGPDIVVAVERDGQWIPVIRTYANVTDVVLSHIVEPLGMRDASSAGSPR